MKADPTYLYLILVWALPVIVLQWLVGGDLLVKRWKVVIPSILIPTVYLTVADTLAISAKTWTIDPNQSLNIFFPLIHVPIEEGIFFLCTNTMLVQGLVFLFSPEMRQRMRNLIRLFRMGRNAWQNQPATPTTDESASVKSTEAR